MSDLLGGARFRLFWLWQYEARNNTVPVEKRTFQDYNHRIQIINSTDMLVSIIDGKFNPYPPSVSGGNKYNSSVTLIPTARPPFHSTNDKRQLLVAVDPFADFTKLTLDFQHAIATYRFNTVSGKAQKEPDNKRIISIQKKCLRLMQSVAEKLDAFLYKTGKGTRSDGTNRAIGLWLYDCCINDRCGVSLAIDKLRKTDILLKLKYEDPDHDKQRQLESLYDNARLCIETCSVLPIKRSRSANILPPSPR